MAVENISRSPELDFRISPEGKRSQAGSVWEVLERRRIHKANFLTPELAEEVRDVLQEVDRQTPIIALRNWRGRNTWVHEALTAPDVWAGFVSSKPLEVRRSLGRSLKDFSRVIIEGRNEREEYVFATLGLAGNIHDKMLSGEIIPRNVAEAFWAYILRR